MTGAASPLALRLRTLAGITHRPVALGEVVIASWTGRDRPSMEGRWAELEAMGIARPPTAPMFYAVAASRVTTRSAIEVIGEHTTGEVEFVLLRLDGRLWVGVGSDHTDRLVETQDAALSKQLCEKPVAAEFWDFDELAGHWDRLRLRSVLVAADGTRTPYQHGEVSAMLPPLELLAQWATASGMLATPEASLLFCGTLSTVGPIRSAEKFEFELEDPVLERRIHHAYEARRLPGVIARLG